MTEERNQEKGNARKGFASMPHEKVQEIGRKGGQKRAQELGHEGYAEMGRKGGAASGHKSEHEEHED